MQVVPFEVICVVRPCVCACTGGNMSAFGEQGSRDPVVLTAVAHWDVGESWDA